MDGASFHGGLSIRRVTEDDTAWLHALGEHCYPDGTYDRDSAEQWIKSLMQSPRHLMLRGERSWIVAWVQSTPFRPKFWTGHFMIVASLGNAGAELRQMNRMVVAWFREKRARRIYWATTGGTDLGPLARDAGAAPCSPTYMMNVDYEDGSDG